MTKKLFSKIVSAILVMAIMLTTVFGCLITVSAAYATGNYTITSDDVPSGARIATTYVTLKSDTGFSSGKFDLMFHDVCELYDHGMLDDNRNVKIDLTANDKNGDGMISAYYQTDENGDFVLDDNGNKIIIEENADAAGTKLPNAYDETYVDVLDEDGTNKKEISQNLYDTKIEIYSAVAADDGATLDASAFDNKAAYDECTFTNIDDGRKFNYNLPEDYQAYEASDSVLEKYFRSYSTVDVVTENLSYAISTVSEDSTGLVARYTQYAQGFEDVSFTASEKLTSVTFKVSFDFSGRTDRMSANAVATETSARKDGRYCADNSVQLGLNYTLELIADSTSEIAGFENTDSDCRKTNFHIHFYNTTSKETDVINSGQDYTVYQGYCGNCRKTDSGYSAPMIAPSFVAERLADSAEVDSNNGVGSYYFHNYKNIYGFNVVYEKDGTLSVNIHFDEYAAGDTFVIGLSDGTKTKYSEFTITNPDASFFATVEHWDDARENVIERDVRALRNTAKMVTIKGLSAKDIDTQLYIARMGNDGSGTKQIGRTHVFSLADYCMKVINEQDVYYVEDIIESDDTVDGTVNNTAASKEEMKAKDKNVAAALINYGKAAKAALNQSYDGNAYGETIYWSGGYGDETVDTINDEVNGVAQAGTATDPIIIDNAEELCVLVSKLGSTSNGVYYEMADGISTIILQPENTDAADVLDLADAQAVRDHFENNPSGIKNWKLASYNANTGVNDSFMGNFDGNGVTVYGMYSTSTPTGLFGRVDNNVKISNINLKNCYSKGYRGGVLIGQVATKSDTNTTTVDNASVINCVSIGWNSTGVTLNASTILGYFDNVPDVNNFITYGCIARYEGRDGDATAGIVGQLSLACINKHDNTPWLNNSIILDIAPYNTLGEYTDADGNITIANTRQHACSYPTMFSNVYTNLPTENVTFYNGATPTTYTYTAGQIKQVDKADLQGNEAVTTIKNNETTNSITNGFDWSQWSYGPIGEYPAPASTDAITKRIEYWDGTEGGESVTYNDDGTIATNTLADNGEAGTADDPIIIDTAEELAYIANATGDYTKNGEVVSNGKNYNTAGVYFKVADDIEAIVLQPESEIAEAIMSLTSSGNVVTHFEKYAGIMKNWVLSQYNTATPFQGNFDGNGVTVYGLYHNQPTTTRYTGLIPVTGNGAVISNVTVANSYMAAGDNLGAITAYSRTGATTDSNTIEFESCAVINCYMTTSTSASASVNRGGILAGNISHNIVVNNCLVYGNDARNTAITMPDGNTGFELSLLGSLTNNNPTNNKITNSIILGATPYVKNHYTFAGHEQATISNVYTDQDVSNVTLYYTSLTGKTTKTFANMTKVKLADMIGSSAQTVVDDINAANGDSRDMYVGTIDGYPSFSEVPALTTELLADYEAMTFVYDQYGASTTEFGLYATSLNLKVNPYMSFTFAFHGNHKTYRDEIVVTFRTDDGKVYTASKIPAYTGENLPNTNGWTNKYPAGRYHLYRLTDIDVIELCKGITINATHDTDAFEAKVSIGGFVLDLQNAYKADPCKYYSTRVEAAKALLFYAKMVNARYA